MRHDILYGDMLNYVNDMNEACAVSEGTFSLERTGADLMIQAPIIFLMVYPGRA